MCLCVLTFPHMTNRTDSIMPLIPITPGSSCAHSSISPYWDAQLLIQRDLAVTPSWSCYAPKTLSLSSLEVPMSLNSSSFWWNPEHYLRIQILPWWLLSSLYLPCWLNWDWIEVFAPLCLFQTTFLPSSFKILSSSSDYIMSHHSLFQSSFHSPDSSNWLTLFCSTSTAV